MNNINSQSNKPQLKPWSNLIKFTPKVIKELANNLSSIEGEQFSRIIIALNYLSNTKDGSAKNMEIMVKWKVLPLGWIEKESKRAIYQALEMSDLAA